MPLRELCAATYHCTIEKMLTAAFQRDFTMDEQGKCKRKFSTFDDLYATLNADQRQSVDEVLIEENDEWKKLVPVPDKTINLGAISFQ